MATLRFILFTGEPKISRDEARRIAQEECARRGWYGGEPVEESDELWVWYFQTECNVRGGNVVVPISMRDGRVVDAGFRDR